MSRHDLHGGVTRAAGHDLRGPFDGPAPLPHRHEQTHEGTHHRVAEGIGTDPHLRESRRASRPFQGQEAADSRAPFAGSAHRGEIPFAQERLRRGIHEVEIQGSGVLEHLAAQKRIPCTGVIADPISVVPRECREARIEGIGHDLQRDEPRIIGEESAHTAFERRHVRVDDDIHMRDLTAGMNPRIRATGTGHRGRLLELQRNP